MGINKVVYNGGTLIDLTGDTVTTNSLMQGYTAHDRTGTVIIGTATGGGGQGNVWQDGSGYIHLDDQSGLSLQTKSVTPTESAQTITADNGYYALEEVDVGAISSSYVGSGVTRRSSSDLSASGATVTAPSGYYASNATKTVASGTEGTPTATKGAVNNHAVSVTPSVTNTAGYISGGTKTGTAVSVSASELVSGTKSISANGTGIDVTNYASVDVSVSGGGGSATVSRTDGQSIPRVQINGTGTTYSANGATFSWEDGDNLKFYLGSSSYVSIVYVNGVQIYSSFGGYYTWTPPSCEVTLEFYRDTSSETSQVSITYSHLDITQNGAYDTTGYGGVVVSNSAETTLSNLLARNGNTLDLPESVTRLGDGALSMYNSLTTLILRRTASVVTLSAYALVNAQTYTVYVPSSLISSYKTANNWSTKYNNNLVDFVAIEGSEFE